MDEVVMPGLEAVNPLGFLAALGTLAVCQRQHPERCVRLSWTDTAVPTPTLHGMRDLEDLVAAILDDKTRWGRSVALDWPLDGPAWTDVKVKADEVRIWLQSARDTSPTDGGRALSLISALVAEVSVDNSEAAKPTDLHFTAGRMRFLKIARQLRDALDEDRLLEALQGPWRYDAAEPSLLWDATDDRIYALSAVNPAADTKLTVPGADWLALMGLTFLPVVGTVGRTLTPGCSGSWHRGGTFSWPVWRPPLEADVVPSLLTLPDVVADPPPPSLARRGVLRVYRSRITRSAQGGYGSFRPATVVFDAQ
jgi:hypothetical protein